MSRKVFNNISTIIVAGVTVPDTPLITAAIYYARAHASDMTYNHIMRSWLFGTLILQKVAPSGTIDLEVHSISAILHDLGWDNTGRLISKDERFEVDGAIAAKSFAEQEIKNGNAHG